jgi:hypothetical protein
MGINDPGGWGAYERLVLAKLEELSDDVKELNQKIDEEVKDIRREQTKQDVAIAMLQVKSGVWGAVAGVVTVALYIGYTLLGGGGL